MSSPNAMVQVGGKMLVTFTQPGEVFKRVLNKGGTSEFAVIDPPSHPAKLAVEQIVIRRSAVEVIRRYET